MPTTETGQATVRCQFCQAWNRVDASRVGDRPKCGNCATPILLDRPLKLDDETFERTVAESTIPVFVDFYANWCAPCRMMAPSVDALAAKHAGRVLVAKLDTDSSQQTAQRFNIRGIPTVIVFSAGAEAVRQAGATQLQGLEQLIRRAGVSLESRDPVERRGRARAATRAREAAPSSADRQAPALRPGMDSSS